MARHIPASRPAALPRRGRSAAALTVAALLASALVVGSPGAAFADDATASVTGTVTSADGSPVELTTVTAWTDGEPVSSADTDETGAYEVTDLPAGEYFLEFTPDPESNLLAEWWDDAIDADTATPLDVPADEVVGDIDAVLVAGSIITGTTNSPGPTPLAGAYVTAINEDGEEVASTESNPDGSYAIPGIRAGTYTLRFDAPDNTGWVTEWWNNARSVDDATWFTVVAGSPVAPRTMVFAAGGQIAGTVTAGGTGIADVIVEAYTADEEYFAEATTATNGSYQVLGLPAGTYYLRFASPEDSAYASEWWNDKQTFATATAVTVATGATVTGRNAVLTTGSTIVGVVTAGDGFVDTEVTLTNTADDSELYATTSPVDGTYSFAGLAAGNYTLGFAPAEDSGYLPVWFSGAATAEQATVIHITTGTETTANIALVAESSLAGTVTGDDAAPLAGVTVTAVSPAGATLGETTTDTDGGYLITGLRSGGYTLHFVAPVGAGIISEWWDDVATRTAATTINLGDAQASVGYDAELASGGGTLSGTVSGADEGVLAGATVFAYLAGDSSAWVASAVTDDDGAYVFAGLAAGSYVLQIVGYEDSGYAPEWYNNQVTFQAATVIPVANGATLGGRNVTLNTGSSIAGHVTAVGGAVGTSYSVTAVLSDDGRDWESTVPVDDDGNYWIPGLAAGSYLLRFDTANGATTEWWQDAASREAATAITLAARTDLDEYNAELGVRPTLEHGTVTIAGTAKVGVKLTARAGTWSPAPVTLAYRWKRNGVAIGGAVASTYVPVGKDAGTTISVTVTGTKSGYTADTATSAGKTVLAGKLTPTATPKITGTAKVGKKLTAKAGTWGPATVKLTYRWYRDGKAIGGATAKTYTLKKADTGTRITVAVTGTKTGYTTVVKTSARTKTVLKK